MFQTYSVPRLFAEEGSYKKKTQIERIISKTDEITAKELGFTPSQEVFEETDSSEKKKKRTVGISKATNKNK